MNEDDYLDEENDDIPGIEFKLVSCSYLIIRKGTVQNEQYKVEFSRDNDASSSKLSLSLAIGETWLPLWEQWNEDAWRCRNAFEAIKAYLTESYEKNNLTIPDFSKNHLIAYDALFLIEEGEEGLFSTLLRYRVILVSGNLRSTGHVQIWIHSVDKWYLRVDQETDVSELSYEEALYFLNLNYNKI